MSFAPPSRVVVFLSVVAFAMSSSGDTGPVVGWGVPGTTSPPDAVNGTAGTASAIAAGANHACAIQAGTDAVVCWGYGPNGETDPPPPWTEAPGPLRRSPLEDSTAVRSRRAPARSFVGVAGTPPGR
jgi:hypothetical protein